MLTDILIWVGGAILIGTAAYLGLLLAGRRLFKEREERDAKLNHYQNSNHREV